MNFRKFFPLVVLSVVLAVSLGAEIRPDPTNFDVAPSAEVGPEKEFKTESWPDVSGSKHQGCAGSPTPCGIPPPPIKPNPCGGGPPSACCPVIKFCDLGTTVPLYRYYHKTRKDHFYTTSFSELGCKSLNKGSWIS